MISSDMCYEKKRLETFREWPTNAAIEPQRIAKAGFYWTGPNLQVKCYFCSKSIQDWEYGDQVMVKHRAINPECPFVLNPLECGNVPMLPTISLQADYRIESARLASFRNWPSQHVTPESLARNGLYYLREEDKVACAFCSVVLHEWCEGDDPLTEHRRANPECPLLFGYMVGNVPIDASGSGVTPSSLPMETDLNDYVEMTRDLLASESSNVRLAEHPQFGVQAHRPPMHARYQTYAARLATFQDWPMERPTPESLAAAGFFYQGMRDHACCFHCNGGLHSWHPEDNPWEEHARWFSKCPFVGIVKGQEFIIQAVQRKPPLVPISQINNPDSCEEQEQNLPVLNQNVAQVDGIVSDLEALEVSNNEMQPEDNVPDDQQPEQVGTENVMENPASNDADVSETDLGDINSEETQQQGEQNGNSDHEEEPVNVDEEDAENVDSTASADERDEDGDMVQQRSPSVEELSYNSSSSESAILVNEPPPCNSSFQQVQSAESGQDLLQVAALSSDCTEEGVEQKSADALAEENRRLQEARLCKVCLDEEVGIVFLPCGHLITCVMCAPNLTICPLCREGIKACVRTFFS